MGTQANRDIQVSLEYFYAQSLFWMLRVEEFGTDEIAPVEVQSIHPATGNHVQEGRVVAVNVALHPAGSGPIGDVGDVGPTDPAVVRPVQLPGEGEPEELVVPHGK